MKIRFLRRFNVGRPIPRRVAKNFDFPAGFKPDKITFSVSGRDMTFDLARSAWLDASGRPIPSSVPASAIKPAPTPPTPAAPEYRSITLDELAEWEKAGSGESGKFTATAYYAPITDAGILEMLNASDDYFFTGKIGASLERVPMVQFKSKARLPEMKHSQKVTLWFTAASKGEEKEAKQYRIIERIEITE